MVYVSMVKENVLEFVKNNPPSGYGVSMSDCCVLLGLHKDTVYSLITKLDFPRFVTEELNCNRLYMSDILFLLSQDRFLKANLSTVVKVDEYRHFSYDLACTYLHLTKQAFVTLEKWGVIQSKEILIVTKTGIAPQYKVIYNIDNLYEVKKQIYGDSVSREFEFDCYNVVKLDLSDFVDKINFTIDLFTSFLNNSFSENHNLLMRVYKCLMIENEVLNMVSELKRKIANYDNYIEGRKNVEARLRYIKSQTGLDVDLEKMIIGIQRLIDINLLFTVHYATEDDLCGFYEQFDTSFENLKEMSELFGFPKRVGRFFASNDILFLQDNPDFLKIYKYIDLEYDYIFWEMTAVKYIGLDSHLYKRLKELGVITSVVAGVKTPIYLRSDLYQVRKKYLNTDDRDLFFDKSSELLEGRVSKSDSLVGRIWCEMDIDYIRKLVFLLESPDENIRSSIKRQMMLCMQNMLF